jgi:hypothetical protein
MSGYFFSAAFSDFPAGFSLVKLGFELLDDGDVTLAVSASSSAFLVRISSHSPGARCR